MLQLNLCPSCSSAILGARVATALSRRPQCRRKPRSCGRRYGSSTTPTASPGIAVTTCRMAGGVAPNAAGELIRN